MKPNQIPQKGYHQMGKKNNKQASKQTPSISPHTHPTLKNNKQKKEFQT